MARQSGQTRQRINHKDHNHSSDKWTTTRCRQSILAGNGPLDEGFVPGERGAMLSSALRREAEASVALDKGEVGTYSVGPVISPKPVMLRMGQIAEVQAMIDRIDAAVDGYALTKSVLVRFAVDDLDVAVIWDGNEWAVEVR